MKNLLKRLLSKTGLDGTFVEEIIQKRPEPIYNAVKRKFPHIMNMKDRKEYSVECDGDFRKKVYREYENCFVKGTNEGDAYLFPDKEDKRSPLVLIYNSNKVKIMDHMDLEHIELIKKYLEQNTGATLSLIKETNPSKFPLKEDFD